MNSEKRLGKGLRTHRAAAITRSGAMRNTMIISALLVFFPVWWYFKVYGNVALWYALLAFLLARGVTLGWEFWKLSREHALAE